MDVDSDGDHVGLYQRPSRDIFRLPSIHVSEEQQSPEHASQSNRDIGPDMAVSDAGRFRRERNSNELVGSEEVRLY